MAQGFLWIPLLAGVIFWRKCVIILLIQRVSIAQLDLEPFTGYKFGLLVAMISCSTLALLFPLILLFGDGRHRS